MMDFLNIMKEGYLRKLIHFLFQLGLLALPFLCLGQEIVGKKLVPQMERLQVSENGHFLCQQNGTPFFWLGDTAWELFNRLKKEEIEHYLDDRQQKGFNVIQTVILANTDKPMKPNRYGETPFVQADPNRPNEKYFELVDWTLKQAGSRNMYLGLLPTWGDKVLKLWSKGQEIFNVENAYIYGTYLGKRYKDYPNIIWIMGGDRPAMTESVDKRPIWEAMIRGIREGTENHALITYHPSGESSSTKFWPQNSPLDINMLQSGHSRSDLPVWEWITRDFAHQPAKPILDGESTYEDHPINWDVSLGYFRDQDIRKQLYRSVFSGACGVTYGHQAIWQFYSKNVQKIVDPDRYWTEALDRPGAFQAGYLKRLILSRPSLGRIPDQSILVNPSPVPGEHPVAFRDNKGTYLMVYLPKGGEIVIKGKTINAQNLTVWWFSPRNGKVEASMDVKNKEMLTLAPPTSEIEMDWVLIAEDATLDYGAPGKLHRSISH